MKRIITLFAMASAVALAPSCFNAGYTTGMGPQGSLFTSVKMTTGINTDVAASTIEAEACQHRIYVFAAFGGQTVSDLALDNNITNIRSVNKELFNILGLYSRMCTIVSGN